MAYQILFSRYYGTILIIMKEGSIKIPQLFYGTAWKKGKTAELVELALRTGFRGIDTACQPKHYNQAGVGQGIAKSGIPRNQLFIQTKYTSYDGQDPNNLPYDPKLDKVAQVKKSLEVSFHNLRTNYLDSLVMHGPEDTLEATIKVWRVFEQFVKQGKVHYLGISNCYDFKFFKHFYQEAHVKPSFLQNRFYSKSGYDKQLRQFCNEHDIKYQSFWTLTGNPKILESKEFDALSKKYKRTPAQIMYRALTQMNIIPLIGTTSEQHMKEDLSIFEFQLNKQDLEAVTKLFH